MPKLTFRNIGLSALGLGILFFVGANQLDDGTLSQSGEITTSDLANVLVNYPIPFAIAPNLQIEGNFSFSNLKQTPTGFEIEIGSVFGDLKGQWKAIGIPDPKLDPRPVFRKLSFGEKLAGVIGLLGSICTIWSFGQAWRTKRKSKKG